MYIVYIHIVSIKIFFGVRHKDLKASPNHQNIRGVKKRNNYKIPSKKQNKKQGSVWIEWGVDHLINTLEELKIELWLTSK